MAQCKFREISFTDKMSEYTLIDIYYIDVKDNAINNADINNPRNK